MKTGATPDAATRQPATKTAKLPSQTQRATAALREMIVNNRLPAGSSYLESELAEMLEMSRTPIREAVVVLEAQGLVEVRPRRGIRVLPLSTSDMQEIYQILTELEGLAVELAASRKLTKVEEKEAEKALKTMEDALKVDDRESWAAADKRFHNLLVDMARNRRLKVLVESYNDQVHRARMLTVRLRPSPTKSNRDHRAVYKAIKAGDKQLARALHTAHRSEAMHIIIDLLKRHGFHQV